MRRLSVDVRLLLFLLLALLLSFVACVSSFKQHGSKPNAPQYYASYPRFKIPYSVRKIAIVGTGDYKDDISALLTRMFRDTLSTPVQVVEPRNLESVLGGKMIEYGTGLSTDEAQAISQMLQVDHVLFFDNRNRRYGNNSYSANYKIKMINTRNGEVVFQSIASGELPLKEPSWPLEETVIFELRYALGDAKTGMLLRQDYGTTVWRILIDSPAYRAGIREGDKILEIGGIGIRNYGDYARISLKRQISASQGDTLRIKFKRSGKVIDSEMTFPIIPDPPIKDRYQKKQKKKSPLKTI